MRSRAAAHGGKTDDGAAFHRGGVGRRQVFGDENGIFGILRWQTGHAGQQFEHAQPDVAHIVGALCEQFVAQGGETLGVKFGRTFPGEGRALSLGHRGVSHLEKIRIVEEFGVSREDRGFGRISLAL